MAPSGTLGSLTTASFARAEAVLATLPEVQAAARDQAPSVPLASALRDHHVRVIAEVKRASPSKGAIAPTLVAADQARRYVAGGAAAISVLTEPTHFGGSLTDLAEVALAVPVPVIRKDFIVAPVQLWEARAAGASAALLIVRALPQSLLERLMATAEEAGLAVLVEIRDEAELERALLAGATVIGVNNRNLETLVIDPQTAVRMIPHIPAVCVAVAESGLQFATDVERVAAVGTDAILVGSVVSASADPEKAVSTMTSVLRRARG